MSEYVIITDSSCDLSHQMVKELELEVLPLAFTIDGKTYRNYPDNREMTPEELTRLQKNGSMAVTSAVNIAEAAEALEPYLQAGKDLLVLGFSSGLSTTYNSFKLAAEELSERYPERKIFAVDTLCASLGQGLLVYLAGKMRAQGKSIEEVRDWVEEHKLNICHWFTVNDLFYLKKGGRVSAATAVVGTMLQIKPIMHVDNEGKLIKVSTVRGRKASITALADKIGELADPDPKGQVMFISHTDSYEEADKLAADIKKRFGVKEVIINHIGPVIGAHTGPGCMALFFLGTHR